MTEIKYEPRSFGTHDGTFHADEVTACALLLQANQIDLDKVYRTRDPSILERCEYVCDVGGVYDSSKKLFDHHQSDYTGDLSSAGMILLYLRERGIFTDHMYHFYNKLMIMGVDAHDIGKDPQVCGLATYSHIISNFTPIRHDCSSHEQNEAFFRALEFARGHISRLYQRYRYSLSCREIVEEAMERDKVCLRFDQQLPWLELFFELGGEQHPATFVLMPTGEHWKLRGIPPTFERRMEVRSPLPNVWAGLLEGELKKVSGINGAIFCHKGRFISVWETKEDAEQALDYALKMKNDNI